MKAYTSEELAVDLPLDDRILESFGSEELVVAGRRPLYYGWVMLPVSMAALIASTPGQTFGISIFNEPMRLSLDLSHGQLAAAYTVGTLLGALPIAYIGHRMDRHGLRRTILITLSLFCGACLFVSLVQGWLMLAAGFCLLRMLGPGALSFLSSNTLSFWFKQRLGMVEGLRQLGMAAAMALVPSLNLWLMTQWGWRGAYALLGMGIWLLLFPTFAWLYRDCPEDVGQQIDGHASGPPSGNAEESHYRIGLTLAETLRTPAFWTVTAGTTLFSLIHTAVFFCVVPIFQERGLAHEATFAMLTGFAVCLAVMQLVGGMLADRVAAPPLLATGMAGLALAIGQLYFTATFAAALAAGASLGAAQGLFFGASQPLWARYFGLLHLGKIRGVLMTINVAASSVGPLFAGITRDLSGDFDLALAVFGLMPIPAAVFSLWITPPQREPPVVLRP